MRRIAVALLLILAFQAMSQKEELNLEDAVVGQWTKFRTKSVSDFKWLKNRKAYSYRSADSLIIVDLDTNLRHVVRPDDLNTAHEELKGLKRIPGIQWTNSNTFVFRKDSVYYEYNMNEKRAYHLFVIPKGGSNVDFCDMNYMAAYTRGNNLYIATIEGDIPVSDVNIENIIYGQAVHRYEFGVSKGTFWSPSGRRLAYYRKDERAVSDYPLITLKPNVSESRIIKYPMAGDSSHFVTLGAYDFATGKNVFMRTGLPKDQYLTNIQWSPDEKLIYIAVLNRDQDHLKLNAYSADSGVFVTTVFEEKSDKYVQPLHSMEFLPKDPNKFLWRSERSGYDHLYLYDLKGDSAVQLTKGEDVVMEGLGFGKNGDYYYFSKATNQALGRSVYRIQLDSFRIDTLTPLAGTHKADFHAESNALFISYTDTATPLIQYVLKLDDLSTDTLNVADDKLQAHMIGKTKLFSLMAEDSSMLNARLITPSVLDSGKRYPVLVYVYNGPGVQLITNSWRARAPLWMNHLAEKGFVVFTLDGRGSENRGMPFEQQTFRNLGELEMQDQLLGLEYLKNLDFVDTTKLAVHGWSYGGFMTTSLMLKHPGAFHVGVAGGPVMNWKFYEIMYTERYMDSPQSNPEGYKLTNNLDKVDQLDGELLIIHGSVDDVVVPQHSISFLQQCVQKGVQVDFFLYPNHPHNVRGRDRIHLMDKVIRYIEDKLEVEY